MGETPMIRQDQVAEDVTHPSQWHATGFKNRWSMRTRIMCKKRKMILDLTFALGFALMLGTAPASAGVLDKQKLLDAQTFWDNRDWDWYKANIPFFECPDADINTTYYYRWELVTKHLTYGSPNSGYSFTEFIDRPFWSGAYGAISCPAGHQLYEVRWLRDPEYARDYSRYWFRTPGAQPRKYSTWLADAIWAVNLVHPDKAFITDLLPDLEKNYQGWEKDHWVQSAGMFWQIGHDDGMEFNIDSRQTRDIMRGAPGYRPSFNAYMWADAMAIAHAADLAGDHAAADAYRAKAAGIKEQIQKRLWDPKRDFFFQMYRDDEQDQDGNVIKANTLTYQSGKFAGSPHGREEIGYVPWQFNLPDRGYESAWKFLMDPAYFYAERGPTTVERNDPMFLLKPTCCWWSGQSWPYATTQTLKGMANLLQNDEQHYVTRADYMKLLRNYALSHRKDGRPYLAEALNPDTGSFAGHDTDGHSNHYFHSGFCDLIITGLAGLKPAEGNTLEVDPLAPPEWEYFAADDVPYHGHLISIVWDKTGRRYGLGAGLRVMEDGKTRGSSPKLEKLRVVLSAADEQPPAVVRNNYAVNNDGDYFPRLSASYVAPGTALSKVNDGNYWYTKDPPNRWTCAGSPNATDWIAVDFGTPRPVDTVKLYFLDDAGQILAPASYAIEYWNEGAWKPIPGQKHFPDRPIGHRPNSVTFPAMDVQKLRAVLTNADNGKSGLTEFEAWGDAKAGQYTPAPPPAGNLAFNPKTEGFPKASASFSDRFGGTPDKAIDGRINFQPNPMNRWTSYGSPNKTDWLEVDFGAEKEIGRAELYIYDDRGGVQAPEKYAIQYWADGHWHDAQAQTAEPAVPTGGMDNTVTFKSVKTSKMRVIFTNKGNARSGVTEMEVWRE
jgi:hypothetical protein